MKKILPILAACALLTACSTAASQSARSRRTPVAQIQVQADQPLATTQSAPVSDMSTPSAAPASANPTAPVAASPTVTLDPSNPSGLDVLSRQSYTANDGFYVVGELLNNTTSPMGGIKITATYYYQRAGKPVVLGTLDGSTMLQVIPAGGRAPFLIGPFVVTTTKAGPVTWYDLQEQGQAAPLPRQDVAVSTANSYSTGSWLYVRGDVQNRGTTDAKFVKAVITLYDPAGNTVGAISTYTNPSTVSAGGSAPFTASTEYWPNFDHFSVQVQAQ